MKDHECFLSKANKGYFLFFHVTLIKMPYEAFPSKAVVLIAHLNGLSTLEAVQHGLLWKKHEKRYFHEKYGVSEGMKKNTVGTLLISFP